MPTNKKFTSGQRKKNKSKKMKNTNKKNLPIQNKKPKRSQYDEEFEPAREQFLRDSIKYIIKENDSDEDEEKFQHFLGGIKTREKIIAQHKMLRDRIQARGMFIFMTRFQQICEDIDNKLVLSSFTTYIAHNCRYMENYNDSINKWHDKRNYLKYIIDLCGSKLTCLCIENYKYSHIMPFINNNCPNLRQLRLQFREIKSEDFKNAFSNMSNLKGLGITWACDDSTLPDTLVDSLEQVGGTLTYLHFKSSVNTDEVFLPDSLAMLFPRLIALENLEIYKFKLTQPILESIGEMKNLIKLHLHPDWLGLVTVYHENMNMYPIGNLKTLESLFIEWHCDITDEFLINLCNNAKNLRVLRIPGTKLTDDGIFAVNKLEQLEFFQLVFDRYLINGKLTNRINEFITDESIRNLRNNQLNTLMLSNCINITDRSVTELVKNLPNLEDLYVVKTNVTIELAKEISRSTEDDENPISVYASDKKRSFESLSPSV